jgi:hypothetical protein
MRDLMAGAAFAIVITAISLGGILGVVLVTAIR